MLASIHIGCKTRDIKFSIIEIARVRSSYVVGDMEWHLTESLGAEQAQPVLHLKLILG